MKRFLTNKLKNQAAVDDSITDAMLGTGEHMCTCAAIVADIIIEQGQESASVKEMLARMGQENIAEDSPAEKKA